MMELKNNDLLTFFKKISPSPTSFKKEEIRHRQHSIVLHPEIFWIYRYIYIYINIYIYIYIIYVFMYVYS